MSSRLEGTGEEQPRTGQHLEGSGRSRSRTSSSFGKGQSKLFSMLFKDKNIVESKNIWHLLLLHAMCDAAPTTVRDLHPI